LALGLSPDDLVRCLAVIAAAGTKVPKPPARSTLHDEVVTLRLVLKTAIRHGWITRLPDLSMANS
jgi:phage gp16-like protein